MSVKEGAMNMALFFHGRRMMDGESFAHCGKINREEVRKFAKIVKKRKILLALFKKIA